jgi:meiotic recombination protein REC8, fungi type
MRNHRRSVCANGVATTREPSVSFTAKLVSIRTDRFSYGVSRVYSQQCGYVLSDLQNFRDKMKGAETVLRDMEIDLEVGRAR